MRQAITMKSSDGNNVDEIDIFGTIGEDWWTEGTSAETVLAAIRASKAKQIKVNINSGGGAIFEGMAMYDAIKSAEAKTTARIMGFAGSMATIVMLAADTVEIVDGSLVMVHNPSSHAGGQAKDLRKEADVLDKLRAGLVRIYSGKTGMTEDEVIALLDDETWLDAEEARSLGLVDKIVGEEGEAATALASLDLMASAPAARIPLRFAASIGGVSRGVLRGKMEATDPEEEDPVATPAEVKEALGLDADATEEEVLAAAKAAGTTTEDDDSDDADADVDDDSVEDEDDSDEDSDDDDEPTASIPDGFGLIDLDELEKLKARAAKADASKPTDADRNERMFEKAVVEGRVPAAKRSKYIDGLEKDFDTFATLLTKPENQGGLPKGLIPVTEIGTSHDSASDEAGGSTPVAYDASLFPQLAKRAASTNHIIETE